MAIDRALLQAAREPTLRFYGWHPPAISLGCCQKNATELAALSALGLPLVRRPSGGGAIVHWHELTYAVILPLGHPAIAGLSIQESYHALHEPILRALHKLGVLAARRQGLTSKDSSRAPLCFHRASELDLMLDDKKLLGSAQRRTRGRLLQHGSLLLQRNPLQERTAALADVLTPLPQAAALAEQIRHAFENLLGPLQRGSLQPVEQRLVQKAILSESFA